MNKIPLSGALVVSLASLLLPAQAPAAGDGSAAAKRAAIAQVSFLTGEWEGEGFVSRGPEKKERFQGWERVEPRLGGQLLVVEGRHTSLEGADAGKVVHEAFAVLTWDDKAKTYRFRTNTAEGRGGDFEGAVENGAFVWTLPMTEGRMRYTLRLDGEGRWFETGEITTDGKSWKKFFEMTLTKRSESTKP